MRRGVSTPGPRTQERDLVHSLDRERDEIRCEVGQQDLVCCHDSEQAARHETFQGSYLPLARLEALPIIRKGYLPWEQLGWLGLL